MAWRLTDLPAPSGPSVLSCFMGGGGSCMGYALAGCEVLGGVEIDPLMMELHRRNLHPRCEYQVDIRSAPLPDRPVDILDGSPPCSSFSVSGYREKAWGQERQFREGATKQRLDDLFFVFLDYAAKVAPRLIVAENVPGLLIGNARAYARRIVEHFRELGYAVSVFRLNAADFGVPQSRERVFFVGQRGTSKPLSIKPTGAAPVTVREAFRGIDPYGADLVRYQLKRWHAMAPGHNGAKIASRRPGSPVSSFSHSRLNPDGVAPTLVSNSYLYHWDRPTHLNARAYARLQSFPDDYDFGSNTTGRSKFVCGMSVPPFLMRGIAQQLIAQVF